MRHDMVPKNKPFPMMEGPRPGAVYLTRTLDLRITSAPHNRKGAEFSYGAVEGTRTLDLRITSAPLYQLSYNGNLTESIC